MVIGLRKNKQRAHGEERMVGRETDMGTTKTGLDLRLICIERARSTRGMMGKRPKKSCIPIILMKSPKDLNPIMMEKLISTEEPLREVLKLIFFLLYFKVIL